MRAALIIAFFSFYVLGAAAQISESEYVARMSAHIKAVTVLAEPVIKQYEQLGMIPTEYREKIITYLRERCRIHDSSKVRQDEKFVRQYELTGRASIASERAAAYGVFIPEKNRKEQSSAGSEARKAIDQSVNRVDEAEAKRITLKAFPELVKVGDLSPGVQMQMQAAQNYLLNEAGSMREGLAKMQDPSHIYHSVLRVPQFMPSVIEKLGEEVEHAVDMSARYYEADVIRNIVSRQREQIFDPRILYERGRPTMATADYMTKVPNEIQTWGDGVRSKRMVKVSKEIEAVRSDEMKKLLYKNISPEYVQGMRGRYTSTSYYATQAPVELDTKRGRKLAAKAAEIKMMPTPARGECLERALENLNN